MNTTLRQVRDALAPHGVAVRRTGEGSELRVNFSRGTEVTAYYTDDLDDALDTGLDMAERMAQEEAEERAESREDRLPARWLASALA